MEDFKNSLNKIEQATIEQWVRDLVIVKTFAGLRFQEAILKKGAEIKGVNYRLSDPGEESKGIDGYIGEIPVSIKPNTYDAKASLPEHIDVKVVVYQKIAEGIEVE